MIAGLMAGESLRSIAHHLAIFIQQLSLKERGGLGFLDSIRGLDKWNSAGYAAAASG